MNFKIWLETHHDEKSNQPLKKGDTLNVFHGFNNPEDAVNTAKYGLSGQVKANRRFSYEARTNPKGLFVTLSKKTALDFAGDGIVIEFIAKYEELEPPVWPQGSYGVQNKFQQVFKSNIQRIEAKKKFEKEYKENPNLPDFIKNSDNPYLAYLLFVSTEMQALFVGNLNPERILAFYDKNKKYTPDEFLKEYSSKKESDKLFNPEDDFDSKIFLEKLKKKYPFIEAGNALKIQAAKVRNSINPKKEFLDIFNYFLWPKQYLPAMLWLDENY